MKTIKSPILLLLLLWLFAGCGNSFDEFGNPGVSPSTATIEVNHVLARSVPSTIDTFRYSGFDSAGNRVYGPVERPREATSVLTNVPVTVTLFQIDYLSGGQTVGLFQTPVELSPGELLVIDDPAWIDAGPNGPAVGLQFLSAPTDTVSGEALSPVRVAVIDADGDVIPTATALVSLTLQSSSGSTLSGTTSVAAVSGIATFTDLVINGADVGATLTASAESLASTTSSPFNVLPVGAGRRFLSTTTPLEATADTIDVGDLNGDGFLDVVTGSIGSELVSVSLGDRLGDYTTTSFAVTGLQILALGDVTGDGILDLVSVSSGPAFQLHVGQGDGTFVAPTEQTLTGVTTVFELKLADVNADGLMDTLATAVDGTGGAIYVSLGSSAGLGTPIRNGLAANGFGFDVGDLSRGTAAVDLAVAEGGTLEVLQGDGAGGFTSNQVLSPTSTGLQRVAIGNFNQQGGNDIATANDLSSLEILENTGSTFTTAPGTPTAFSGNSALALKAGDFNSDSVPDLVLLESTASVGLTFPGSLYLAVVDPTSTVSRIASFEQTRAVEGPGAVALGDGNSDAILDVFVANDSGKGFFAKLLGNGQGEITPVLGLLSSGFSLDQADVNGDNLLDLVLLNESTVASPPTNFAVTSQLLVYLRQSDGSFSTTEDFEITNNQEYSQINLEDMSGDSIPDAVCLAGAEVHVFVNPGTGEFGSTPTVITLPGPVSEIDLGPVNSDEIADIVGSDSGQSSFVLMLSNDGTAFDYTPSTVPTSANCRQAIFADLDQDTNLDVVTAQEDGFVGVFLNQSLTFTEQRFPVSDLEPRVLGAGLLNSDTFPDLFVVSVSDTGPSESYTLINDGSGGLGTATSISGPDFGTPGQVLIGDINLDGVQDVVVVDFDLFGAGYFLNFGNGLNFEAGTSLVHAGGDLTSPRSAIFADVDGDGVEEPTFATAPLDLSFASGPAAVSIATLLILGLSAFLYRRRQCQV